MKLADHLAHPFVLKRCTHGLYPLIMRLSDSIAVMYEGEFLGVGKAEELSREEVEMMMGGIRQD